MRGNGIDNSKGVLSLKRGSYSARTINRFKIEKENYNPLQIEKILEDNPSIFSEYKQITFNIKNCFSEDSYDFKNINDKGEFNLNILQESSL